MGPAIDDFDSRIRDLLPDIEHVYTDIHAHPELSMQETRTAGVAADRLRAAGFDVTPAAPSRRLGRAAGAAFTNKFYRRPLWQNRAHAEY